MFARSKVVPEDTSNPPAEVKALSTLAATGFVVQRAFGKYHKSSIKLSDSMVALHWISSQRKSLKAWVRGHVIEINRLSDQSTWHYIESSKNPADIGTRKGVTVAEVAEDSDWIKGKSWMKRPKEELPIIHISEIKLGQPDIIEFN